jgi:glycoside/pentoside/hexuronide:cation symporter, GPH family
MAFIPVWNILSRKIGKKKGYIAGMLILAAMITLIFFFGHTAGIPFFLVVMFFSGIGFATGYIFPWAIVPDAIDYDYLLTGEKREGIFYGLWTFSSKLGQALAATIVGWVLNYSGFIANVAQGESALMAIRLLLGPIAILFYLLAALVLAFYPIDEKMYTEIRAKVSELEGIS